MTHFDSLYVDLHDALQGLVVFNNNACIIGKFSHMGKSFNSDSIEITFLNVEENKYWVQIIPNISLLKVGVPNLIKNICTHNKLLNKSLYQLAFDL